MRLREKESMRKESPGRKPEMVVDKTPNNLSGKEKLTYPKEEKRSLFLMAVNDDEERKNKWK